ncbi:ABC transporter ATP-binding protein [Roseivivax sediminis]|uniref:Putative ABC transport system ATP-binding protein n=1 Tax=Roseivivax sediminis TaxID=936889 RepID=A0A1I2CPQ7_9RHOB|nr:ABC transporter ATP-binding protein [Roseivivax sediminis]SFE70238.1 putative ABC transport system ATP-binding protein [Roseivivax sediminis]
MTLDLTLKALAVTSDRGRRLLDVDRLEVPAGSLIGVRGPSGAGKSTLLYALAGLLEGLTGSVHWGDTDLAALTPGARAVFRARRIGLIFQDFLLFDELGALGNASLAAQFRPRKDRTDIVARAASHLSRLGVPVDRRTVATFSGGERQRVAIARALANDAGILLADEPTASLHREAADQLIEDLVALAREGGKTMVAVSHDGALLARMDRVLTVEDGRLVSDARAEAA